jgi:hypothetical protein
MLAMLTATSKKKKSDASNRRCFAAWDVHTPSINRDTRAVHSCAMAQHDDSDRQAWLDALNALVQTGLIEAVSIAQDGEPSYRLASRYSRRANHLKE